MAIYASGELGIGDYIYFTNNEKIKGNIEHIGPRSVAIRTLDKRLMYVPNAFFSSRSVVNVSKMTHRRVLQKIPVGWITSLATLDKIIQEVRVIVHNHPGIDKTQSIRVHFTGFSSTGLEVTIYAFTKTKDYRAFLHIQENILREAKRTIEKHAGAPPAQIAYMLPDHKPTALPSNHYPW